MTSSSIRAFEDFINPWIGAADDDELIERFREFDCNDGDAVRKVITSDLLDGCRQFDDVKKRIIKAALAEAAVHPTTSKGASGIRSCPIWTSRPKGEAIRVDGGGAREDVMVT